MVLDLPCTVALNHALSEAVVWDDAKYSRSFPGHVPRVLGSTVRDSCAIVDNPSQAVLSGLERMLDLRPRLSTSFSVGRGRDRSTRRRVARNLASTGAGKRPWAYLRP